MSNDKNNQLSSNSNPNLTDTTPTSKKPTFLERHFSEPTVKKIKLFGFFFQHVFLEIALPMILYFTLKNVIGELLATIISSIPTLLSTIFTIAVHRRFEPLPIIIIVSFFIGLGLSLGFNNAKLNQVQGAIITGAIGLAYFISLCFPKPLTFYFARPWVTKNDPEKIKEWDAQWEIEGFRKAMRVITMVWGAGFIIQAIINIILIFTISLDLIIILGPVLTYGNIGILVLWTTWYGHMARKRGERRRTQELEQQQQQV